MIHRKVLLHMAYGLLRATNVLLDWAQDKRPLIDEPLTDAYIPPVPPALRVIRADD
jgi:hypothetical protein